MSFTSFISEQYIKDNSVINANVDPALLRPTIRDAQETYILPILGTNLYNTLMAMVSGAPTVTLTGNYGVLLHDYVQPCLLWYTIAESTIPIAYRITNKDIVRKTSPNSTPGDLNEVLNVKDWAFNKAQLRADRLVKYLMQYASTLYSEYNSPGNTIDTVRPRKFVWSDKISLGKYKTKSSLNRSTNTYDNETPKDDCG